MILRILPLLVFSASLLGGTDSLAATRTIQFAGAAVSEAQQSEVAELIVTGACYVTVVNTGETDQIIDEISFVAYQGGSTAPGYVNGFPITYALRTPTTSFATGNACIGQTLSPRGLCIARFPMEAIPHSGAVRVCAGRVVVRDAVDAAPGSVVAAGAISTFHESMVRGGQFSGAVYFSGVHMSTSPNVNASDSIADHDDGSINITSGVPPYESQQMNPYCEVGCRLLRNAAACARICGGLSSGEFDELDGNTAMVNFWTFKAGDTTSDPENEGAPTSGTDTGTNFQYGIATASGHMTGGMVYELTVGPFNRICSGMQAYYDEDGDDFRHAGAVDSHSVNKILQPGRLNYPPERLMCQHRHGFLDPYSSVDSTSSFSINGGMPF